MGFYCPERAFLFLYPRRNMLRLNLYTGGKKLGRVKQFEFERGAEKWGGISITSAEDLEKALPWVNESHKRIKATIARNEPTGWYARLESTEGQ